jgi:hypothetical protein
MPRGLSFAQTGAQVPKALLRPAQLGSRLIEELGVEGLLPAGL